MRRSRAFVLTEILTGMALQASFLLVMCTAFYMMLSFYTRTQQTLTARDRGQRVIAYFDARIKKAGGGMWRCTSSEDVREALWPIASLTASPKKALSNQDLALPVAITYLDQDAFSDTDLRDAPKNIITNSLGHSTYCGNIVTLIYAERDNVLHLAVVNENMESADIDTNPQFWLFGNDKINGRIRLSFNFKDTDFYNYKSGTASPRVICDGTKRYASMLSIGFPFQIETRNNKTIGNDYVVSISRIGTKSTIPAKINPMDELLYLKCTRLFVEGSGVDSNFKYQNLTSSWSNKTPHEKGVLEIYMELDTVTKIFDLYVLSTGGEDNNTTRSKPENWPSNARWKNEYLKQSLYLSHASWKLHNLENITL